MKDRPLLPSTAVLALSVLFASAQAQAEPIELQLDRRREAGGEGR